MKKLPVKPGLQALIDGWHSAKDAEKQWTEYRRSLEASITKHYEAEFAQILGELEQTQLLSESVEITQPQHVGLVVKIARELKVDQTEAAMFLTAHPELLNVLLKVEYKPTSSQTVLAARFSDVLGAQVERFVQVKAAKPSFSAK